jgi:gluconolactonase
MKKAIPVLLFLFVTHSFVLAQHQTSVVETGAKLVKLAGDFKFTEGPAVDKVGNIFFTDQPNDRIMKWSMDEKLTTFM